MKRITDAEMASIHADAQEVLQPGGDDKKAYQAKVKKYSALVIVEVPIGALIDELAGYAWAWKLQGRIEGPMPITKSDRFDAQGLEGKVRVKMRLWNALFVWLVSKEHRIQIFKVSESEVAPSASTLKEETLWSDGANGPIG